MTLNNNIIDKVGYPASEKEQTSELDRQEVFSEEDKENAGYLSTSIKSTIGIATVSSFSIGNPA